MKTIIAIWHVGGKGKSETIREFANLLLLSYPSCAVTKQTHPSIPASDISWIVTVNGKTIGIESCGDPYTNLTGRLNELSQKHNCDIIICATRTKGETVDAVNALSSIYQVIWTSTYDTAPNLNITQQSLNQLKAKHILDILQSNRLI
ncbi:MAG: hypothetical protein J6M38_04500 [Lentisphaeria bacterium]|nr:hypothetical protein [Lentisphaeria bacterium]